MTDSLSTPLLGFDSQPPQPPPQKPDKSSENRIVLFCICIGILLIIALPSASNSAPHLAQFSAPDLAQFPTPHERNPSYLVSGRNGAVASEEARCSAIGIDVLKSNGTATDAAIATALCIGVINSFSSGIGGGGFMLIKPPTCPTCPHSKPISIDFRETIPGGEYYHKRFQFRKLASQIGGLAVGIPGELAGFEEAYRLHGGGVSWERLFEPSIALARKFKVGEALNQKLYHDGGLDHSEWIKKQPEWAKVFFPYGRNVSHVGDLIERPEYARTLEILAREGARAFYNGNITSSLVNTINAAGGKLTRADFENYKAIVRPALQTSYLNRTVYSTAGPSSGPMLLYLLNILEGYDLPSEPRTALSEHRFIESLKHAFARRTELADPSFLNKTELARIDTFVSKPIADLARAQINDSRTFDYRHYKPRFDPIDDHGTSHISVVDSAGSAVALTTTVNLIFGSRVMDPKTGIILNDENDDFSVMGRSNHFDLFASPLNYPSRGKRPVSSIAPLIIDEQDSVKVWAVLGASGGSRIPSAVAGTLLKLDWGYDLSHAIEDARVHHQLLPDKARIETSYRPDWMKELSAKGHAIEMVDIYTGLASVHGVMRRPDGLLLASSDSRKHGVPAAY